MRDYIDIIENEVVQPEQTKDDGLQGSLNFGKLTGMLRGVDNPKLLQAAMKKVINGRQDTLTLKEAGMLAKAFISILHTEPNDRMAIIRTMNSLHTKQ